MSETPGEKREDAALTDARLRLHAALMVKDLDYLGVREDICSVLAAARPAPMPPSSAAFSTEEVMALTDYLTERTASPLGSDRDAPALCQPNGLMFDALGEPRVRYVRITLDGSHMVATPAEADAYMADAKSNDDQSAYTLTAVYLSEREADGLPEFDGF